MKFIESPTALDRQTRRSEDGKWDLKHYSENEVLSGMYFFSPSTAHYGAGCGFGKSISEAMRDAKKSLKQEIHACKAALLVMDKLIAEQEKAERGESGK